LCGWPEYLLQATDGDFLMVHRDDLAALDPDDVDCEAIEGWGDYRMRRGTIEVAVSFEDPGIQFIMEGVGDLAGTLWPMRSRLRLSGQQAACLCSRPLIRQRCP
jgi:hypothetical protein